MPVIRDEGFIFLTNNARDFQRLYEQEQIHSGLINGYHSLMETITELARYLRQLRLQKNLSQTKISRDLCVGLSTYREMEAGSDTVAIRHWIKAWEYFGLQGTVANAMREEVKMLTMFDDDIATKMRPHRKSKTPIGDPSE